MPITDPEAIRFTRKMREIKKMMRTIDVVLDDQKFIYTSGVKDSFIGFEGETVAEDVSDGRTPFTGQDVIDMVAEYAAFVARMDTAGVRDTVRKGIVGTLTIE